MDDQKDYHRIFLILALLIISCLMGCDQPKVELIHAKDLTIPRNRNERFIDYLETDSMNIFVMLNTSDVELRFYNENNYEVKHIIALSHLLSQEDVIPIFSSSFHLHSPDTIIFAKTNCIFHIDILGNEKNKWVLDDCFSDNGLKISVASHIPVVYSNRKIYAGITAHSDCSNFEGRRFYFNNIMPQGVIDIEKDTTLTLLGEFPSIYCNGQNFMDYSPYFCIENNNLVLSYGVNDSLFIYDDFGFVNKVKMRSHHFKNPSHFPDDSANNYSYYRKYYLNEARYQRIVYSGFNEMIYRMVIIPTALKNDDDTFRKANNWSLMVIDRDYKLLGEIMFNSEEYGPFFHPTDKGIMLWKMMGSESDSSIVSFFKIEKQ
nr:DUF4221 family protein [Bacteroidota bacterium]